VTGYDFLDLRPTSAGDRRLRRRERHGSVRPHDGVALAGATAFTDMAAELLRDAPDQFRHVFRYDSFPPVTLVWEYYGSTTGALAQLY
jgi:hypothetical protein